MLQNTRGGARGFPDGVSHTMHFLSNSLTAFERFRELVSEVDIHIEYSIRDNIMHKYLYQTPWYN